MPEQRPTSHFETYSRLPQIDLERLPLDHQPLDFSTRRNDSEDEEKPHITINRTSPLQSRSPTRQNLKSYPHTESVLNMQPIISSPVKPWKPVSPEEPVQPTHRNPHSFFMNHMSPLRQPLGFPPVNCLSSPLADGYKERNLSGNKSLHLPLQHYLPAFFGNKEHMNATAPEHNSLFQANPFLLSTLTSLAASKNLNRDGSAEVRPELSPPVEPTSPLLPTSQSVFYSMPVHSGQFTPLLSPISLSPMYSHIEAKVKEESHENYVIFREKRMKSYQSKTRKNHRSPPHQEDGQSDDEHREPNHQQPSNVGKMPTKHSGRDASYLEKRRKNNEAAKRSRDARKAKEDEIAIRATFLEEENVRLRIEIATLRTNNYYLGIKK